MFHYIEVLVCIHCRFTSVEWPLTFFFSCLCGCACLMMMILFFCEERQKISTDWMLQLRCKKIKCWDCRFSAMTIRTNCALWEVHKINLIVAINFWQLV